jgi:hypothetical protein
MIGRHGAFVSRGGVRSGLDNVDGLRTIAITYRVTDGEEAEPVYGSGDEMEEGAASKRMTRRVTVDFGAHKDARQRELAIARAIQDHARSLIREDSSKQVYITLVRVSDPIQATPSKRPERRGDKTKRKATGKAKPKAKAKSKAKATRKGPAKASRKPAKAVKGRKAPRAKAKAKRKPRGRK